MVTSPDDRGNAPWRSTAAVPGRAGLARWRGARAGGLRQPIEETLHGEVLQQFLEEPALRAGLVQQPLADGGAQIAATHSTASRYGRITFSTRSTFANLDRSW